MRHLLCFGDSNTWGYVPASGQRFRHDVRWPGVLQARLGGGYRVIEEGLNGRTTVHEDAEREDRNGRRLLGPLLESHAPLDLLIVMLGTNDLMPCYASGAADVARGAAALLDLAAASAAGRQASAPPLLLIAPPRIVANGAALDPELHDAVEESAALGACLRSLAEERGCDFLDAAGIVSPSARDGVHLDAAGHRLLGEAVAEAVANSMRPRGVISC